MVQHAVSNIFTYSHAINCNDNSVKKLTLLFHFIGQQSVNIFSLFLCFKINF